jgi:hypothetical protein
MPMKGTRRGATRQRVTVPQLSLPLLEDRRADSVVETVRTEAPAEGAIPNLPLCLLVSPTSRTLDSSSSGTLQDAAGAPRVDQRTWRDLLPLLRGLCDAATR